MITTIFFEIVTILKFLNVKIDKKCGIFAFYGIILAQIDYVIEYLLFFYIILHFIEN